MEHNRKKKCLPLAKHIVDCGAIERGRKKKIIIKKKNTMWLNDDEENESAAWMEVVASYDYAYRGADKKKTLCL